MNVSLCRSLLHNGKTGVFNLSLQIIIHVSCGADRATPTRQSFDIYWTIFLSQFWSTLMGVACENIRFARNVLSDEERGETDVFADYDGCHPLQN